VEKTGEENGYPKPPIWGIAYLSIESIRNKGRRRGAKKLLLFTVKTDILLLFPGLY
jgi:hypothetical protein